MVICDKVYSIVNSTHGLVFFIMWPALRGGSYIFIFYKKNIYAGFFNVFL